MIKKLSTLLLYGLLAASPVLAQDPGKGKRGPTTTQVDVRVNYSNNVLTQQYLGKFWTGDELGIWGVLGANTTQGNGDDGLESMVALAGPRGRAGPLHVLTFVGKSFGMREGVDDVAMAGIFASYDVRDGNGELTGTLHYFNPEENPDKYFYGLSYAESVTEQLKLGAGFTAVRSDGNTFTDARILVVIKPSPVWHVRLSYDHPVNNLEENKSRTEALVRLNLPF